MLVTRTFQGRFKAYRRALKSWVPPPKLTKVFFRNSNKLTSIILASIKYII